MRNTLLAACATAALAGCGSGMGPQAMDMSGTGAKTAAASSTDTTNSMTSAPAPIFAGRGGATPQSERNVMDTTNDMTSDPAPIGGVVQEGHRFADRSGRAPSGKASNYMDTTNSTVTDPGASGAIATAESSSNINGGAPTMNERHSPMSGKRSATGTTVPVMAMSTAPVTAPMATMDGSAAAPSRRSEIGGMAKSDLVGTDVVDPDGRKIGEVTDIVAGPNGQGVRAVLVEAGSYLGTGQRVVAVDVGQLTMSQGDGGELVTTMSPDRVTRIVGAGGRETYVLVP